MKHMFLTAAAAICVSTSAMATTLSDQYSAIAVFGDSLSDNGNLFGTTGQPPAPYVDGRFSNGPVWSEAIATELSGGTNNPALGGSIEGSINLAFGGARADNDTNSNGPIPSVQTQIGVFLASGGTFAADEIAAHWSGANDIFQDLAFGNGTAVGSNTAFDASANISFLIAAGAKNLLVFNLPDIGQTPSFRLTPLAGDATDATVEYNRVLGNEIDRLAAASPDVTFFEVDVFSIFNDIIDDPAAFGVSNTTEGCILDFNPCAIADADVQNTFLFFDGVHPTQTGHRLIEAAARSALAPSVVPLPAGAPLYLLALAGFGLVSRRRA